MGLGGFAVRHLGLGPGAGRWVFSDCGVLGSLPCVGCRAHGKDFSLSCIFLKTHDKGVFAVRF
jgi:hypothetical protein